MASSSGYNPADSVEVAKAIDPNFEKYVQQVKYRGSEVLLVVKTKIEDLRDPEKLPLIARYTAQLLKKLEDEELAKDKPKEETKDEPKDEPKDEQKCKYHSAKSSMNK